LWFGLSGLVIGFTTPPIIYNSSELKSSDMEIWKELKDYNGYAVSNLGNVKSLRFNKERILKQQKTRKGYLRADIVKDKKRFSISIHQLVAIAFLNHKPNGNKLVVHHKDNVKTNNRLYNLEIITNRDNSFTHHKGTSEYVGVCWDKSRNKWSAEIRDGKKRIKLGRFDNENEASEAYQKELKRIICQ
jgi:hypothetical protein